MGRIAHYLVLWVVSATVPAGGNSEAGAPVSGAHLVADTVGEFDQVSDDVPEPIRQQRDVALVV